MTYKFFTKTLILLMLLSSCNNIKENKKEIKDEITVNLEYELKTIDPTLNSSSYGFIYINHAFEGLLNKDTNNNIIEGVANKWEISKDNLVYTFHLRDNAKWSDDKKVTARDFLYSFRRAVNPKTASPMSYLMEYIKNAKDITKGLKSVESLGVIAADENTLIIELEAPTLYFLDIVASGGIYVPVREDIIELYKDDWTWNPETYIGNGAYKMVERKPDELIAFEINTNYWDYKNQVAKRINFVLMADEYIALNSVRTGDVDFSITAPPIGEIENLIKDGLMAVSDIIGCYYIDVNTKDKALSDKRVRKALSLAIDRNYIVENIVKAGNPAGAFVPYGAPDVNNGDFREIGGDYINLNKEDYSNNVKIAKRLMQEAGYPNGQNFPVLKFLVDSNREIPIFEAVQQMWKEHLGIDTSISQQEWAVFLQTLYTDKNYTIGRSGWTADYNDPMTFLGMFLSYSPQNHALFTNREYDNLLKTAMNTIDQNIRMDSMHKAEAIFMNNDVIIPLYFYATPTLISPKLKGVIYDNLAKHKFSYAYIEE